MFGFGKKQISNMEFGQGLVQLASEAISSDCSRALGMRFENWDGSRGWSNFLLSRGIPIDAQKLHFRLWMHAAIQTFCTRFDEGKRRAVTQGAMTAFTGVIVGYDTLATYASLEQVFNRTYRFDQRIAQVKVSEESIGFLPDPAALTFAAKFLVQEFAFVHMPNPSAFIDDIASYSGTLGASVGTVARAVDHIEQSFKVV